LEFVLFFIAVRTVLAFVVVVVVVDDGADETDD